MPFGASLNSRQMNTPQNAETIVAPCPKPYASAAPAAFAEIKLRLVPKHQIEPPRMPTKWSFALPSVKYDAYETLLPPSTGNFIASVLKTKFETRMPAAKTTIAVYGESLPLSRTALPVDISMLPIASATKL